MEFLIFLEAEAQLPINPNLAARWQELHRLSVGRLGCFSTG